MKINVLTHDQLHALISALTQYTDNQRAYLDEVPDAPESEGRALAAAEGYLDQLNALFAALTVGDDRCS